MIQSLDTYTVSHKKSSGQWRRLYDSSYGIQGWTFYDFSSLRTKINDLTDVIVNYNFTPIETDFSSIELTHFATQLSECAFAEAWNNEEDDYWDSY